MQVVELKESNLKEKIEQIEFKPSLKYEEWDIYLNGEKQSGAFEKSHLRLFIECLDFNGIDTPELLLNGARVGYIDNDSIKALIHKLDNLIHH